MNGPALAAMLLLAPVLGSAASEARGAAGPASGAAPSAFQEANRLYEESRFEAAVEAYRRLLEADPDDPALAYNLGNAYFRLSAPGSLGQAILFYERAFALSPRDADLHHNLDFALRRAGETLIPPGTPPALFVLFHMLSAAELAAFHWVGFWATMLLGSAFLLREASRDRLRPWLTAAVCGWLFAAAWWGARAATGIPSPGVIVSDSEARSGPGENFPVNFKVPEGRRVSRLDTRSGWVEIGVLKEGVKGWVSSTSVEAF